MKVHIGPCIRFIGPYQIAEKIFFWVKRSGVYADLDEPAIYGRWDYRACDKLGDWLSKTWLNDFCQWLYSKRSRKVNIKLHDYDTWNMDDTLALIIVPMLKQLRDTKHGSSYIGNEDLPEHLRSTGEELDTDTNNVELRWDWALNEMILAFEAELDDSWEQKHIYGVMDYTWEKDEDGNLTHQVQGPNHTFNMDMESMKAEAKRYENGRILFAKYYKGLWD